MRNIMLAATAIAGFGVLAAGTANAQMANQGIVTTNFGNPTQSGAFPEAGTVTVYLKTRFEAQVGIGSDNMSVQPGVGKVGGPQVQEYVRIYPGFDGVTKGGLQYGAALEIRQENAAIAGANNITNQKGVAGALGTGLNSSTQNILFFRREGGYVGTATLGRVWFGQTDGALSRLNVGISGLTGDPEGGWNGGAQRLMTGNAVLNYVFPVNGPFYAQNRIAYVSPVFAGFDFAASYEPNATVSEANSATALALATSSNATSLYNTSGALGQRRNTFDAAVRYKGSFGGVAVAAEVGTMQSGYVASTGNTVLVNSKNKGVNLIDAGLQATMSGLTLAGHFTGGAMNADNSILVAGQKNLQAFALSASYAMGRTTIGTQFTNQLSAGSAVKDATGAVTNSSSMLHEVGISVGATYDYAPGAEVFVSGIYGTRHQASYNFLAGANGNANHSTTARAIAVGNVFVF